MTIPIPFSFSNLPAQRPVHPASPPRCSLQPSSLPQPSKNVSATGRHG
jgi:hypothetical protein